MTSSDATTSRRSFLQVGYSGLLGLGLPSLLASRARAAVPRAKSVLIVFLPGGPSQLETFDMKPDAPAEIRGEFQPISTSVPGIQISEHLPQLARRMDRTAVLRTLSMSPSLATHELATQVILAGVDALPPGAKAAASRNAWPCFASALDHLRPRRDGLPSGVNLPYLLRSSDGTLVGGQHAGLLGARHDPWQVHHDPAAPTLHADPLGLPIGLSIDRLSNRRALLSRVDEQRRSLESLMGAGEFAGQQKKAFEMLASGRLAPAFDLDREPDRVRDRYGRHLFGQSLLMARRLLQAGVPIVQANMVLGYSFAWDTHNANCKLLKEMLLPPLDQSVSALLDDLEATGLSDDVLVVMLGEFGRTPKLGGTVTGGIDPTGRDHWTSCFPAVFAGAGVRGGQTIGVSDRFAAYPQTTPYAPSDLGATVFAALGLDLSSELRDRLSRPLPLTVGRPITSVFDGA